MNVKVVLVGVEGEVNLGFVMRLAANFDVKRVVLVEPRAAYGEEARRYAAKAAALLEPPLVVGRLEEAFEPGELRVCTSAIAREDDVLRNAITPQQLAAIYEETGLPIALVFGRESTGLTRRELESCDVLVNIQSSDSYPALNLSHAVAILLYELYVTKRRCRRTPPASEETLRFLEDSFNVLADCVVKDEGKARSSKIAFRRVVKRAQPTEAEARRILYVLRRARRRASCSMS
ncbi:MAG: TrmH family RNA methyltransferase [Fervidicoccaceae archaeon]